MANLLQPMQMTVISSLGHKQSNKIYCQLWFFWSQDNCLPSQSYLYMWQICPPSVLQSMYVVQSARDLSFSFFFFFRSSTNIFCTVSLLTFSSSAIIQSNRVQFCSNSCRTFFDFAIHLRGDHSWGCLEHLTALHESIHTSQKHCNALLLHLHRPYEPFQQFVLQFYRL